MGKKWKVEIRTTCKICGKKLVKGQRTYCSPKCRVKFHNDNQNANHYGVNWQRKKRDAIASIPDPDKVQCLLCGKYYVQVCSHVWQVHGLSAREYKEYFDLEVKQGITPEWYKKLKGDQAISNGTWRNLVAGTKYRFKKGDTRAGNYTRSHITVEKLRKHIKMVNENRKTIDEDQEYERQRDLNEEGLIK